MLIGVTLISIISSIKIIKINCVNKLFKIVKTIIIFVFVFPISNSFAQRSIAQCLNINGKYRFSNWIKWWKGESTRLINAWNYVLIKSRRNSFPDLLLSDCPTHPLRRTGIPPNPSHWIGTWRYPIKSSRPAKESFCWSVLDQQKKILWNQSSPAIATRPLFLQPLANWPFSILGFLT